MAPLTTRLTRTVAAAIPSPDKAMRAKALRRMAGLSGPHVRGEAAIMEIPHAIVANGERYY
jgi:chromosomal replication initiation ATPase DnaA